MDDSEYLDTINLNDWPADLALFPVNARAELLDYLETYIVRTRSSCCITWVASLNSYRITLFRPPPINPLPETPPPID